MLRKILPSKSKCMFIATALVKPLVKIGLMYKKNVAPLYTSRLLTNFHAIRRIFAVLTGGIKGMSIAKV